MSSASGAARSRSTRAVGAAAERARLTVVPRTLTRPPQIPFAVLTAVALIGGVVGLLVFNTNMAAASFRVNTLQQRLATLQAQEDRLNLTIDKMQDPQRLARRARALGMVPMGSPAFVRLSDGKELGNPQVARRPAPPKPTALPSASASGAASPSAGPTASPSPTGSPTTQPSASPTSNSTTSATGTKKKSSH